MVLDALKLPEKAGQKGESTDRALPVRPSNIVFIFVCVCTGRALSSFEVRLTVCASVLIHTYIYTCIRYIVGAKNAKRCSWGRGRGGNVAGAIFELQLGSFN